jgi:hypothetical protein
MFPHYINMPARISMNISNSGYNARLASQIAVRSVNSQVNTGLRGPSVGMNLMAPMINRVASAKASCGACGK